MDNDIAKTLELLDRVDAAKNAATDPTERAKHEAVAQEIANHLRSLQALTPETAVAAAPSAPVDHGVLQNIGLGALNGASNIGSTLLWPVDKTIDLIGGQTGPLTSHQERVAALNQFYGDNANPESKSFRVGNLGGTIAGTAGAGPALGAVAKSIPALASFAPALSSGGMTLGPATTGSATANAAIRAAAGAAVGGAQAGLSNPESAGTGAVIGGLIPGVAKTLGTVGDWLAPKVSPAVSALYQRAQDLGINVPLDRLLNSRPLNALASSLNYIPFSGRTTAEDELLGGINRAASRTMGQDTSNLALAVKQARNDLGTRFNNTLSGTDVKFDNQFLNDLSDAAARARAELVPQQSSIIENQIDNILGKDAGGYVPGEAAYNIKRTLDRIGTRNSPEAFYARDVRGKLIDALNRSLGPDEAANFATVRQQYRNMKTLENIVPNGAEGLVTAGKLGALKNPASDLQEVADIAAQFGKAREGLHGAAQRVFMLGGAGLLGGASAVGQLAPVAATFGAGRLANSVLNSQLLANALLKAQGAGEGTFLNAPVRALPIALSSAPSIP